jgi:uncharacterized membrane protein YkvA (DUF1232 family)
MPEVPSGADLDRAELPGGRLLSTYDRLRERMLETAARKSQRLGKPTVEALLLVPDVFVLLVRLTLDRNVPGEARALIGGALAYFLLPFDLFPEGMVGGVGYLDDLVLATAVLSQALGGELEPYARRYWNGDQELRTVLHDVSRSASTLLGRNLYDRLKHLLARRGVAIDETPPRPGGPARGNRL